MVWSRKKAGDQIPAFLASHLRGPTTPTPATYHANGVAQRFSN